MAKITTGLGKGLGALIDTDSLNVGGSSSINDIALDLIVVNTNQPRTHFDPEAMEELATSIREIGVVSPITLRKNEDNTYLLIAGERRYRAAKMIGLKSIPAYIRTAADDQVMEMALVENIQREDLNAIEIALAFYRLMEEYSLTQERLSERVGKKRATIANYLRLLRLPAEIQIGIKDKKIDMGHARAILGLNDPVAQLHLYEMILKQGFSVRKVEELVRLYNETESFEKKRPTASKEKPAEYQELKSRLTRLFDTRVKLVSDDKGKGKIIIPFKDDDELSRIMGLLDHIDKN
ncbi:MAG: ParB/RepB/Spo0J family partition protein [Paludibacter sp.]|jgi:ParB family chromosome partitioning protein|nr:ParB/RepB/Spo0J family partition protein [Paludibacter sp.]HPM10174.1 ParB/RepB/Spo0J family partition protein [Paludibacter sp.]